MKSISGWMSNLVRNREYQGLWFPTRDERFNPIQYPDCQTTYNGVFRQ
jgi:hypothetical protein